MEKSTVHSSLLIVCLVLGLLVVVGESTASFKDCYKICFISCVIGGKNLIKCAAKCLKDCVLPASSVLNLNDAQGFFCKLGCASTLCTNFSTKEDPGE